MGALVAKIMVLGSLGAKKAQKRKADMNQGKEGERTSGRGRTYVTNLVISLTCIRNGYWFAAGCSPYQLDGAKWK